MEVGHADTRKREKMLKPLGVLKALHTPWDRDYAL